MALYKFVSYSPISDLLAYRNSGVTGNKRSRRISPVLPVIPDLDFDFINSSTLGDSAPAPTPEVSPVVECRFPKYFINAVAVQILNLLPLCPEYGRTIAEIATDLKIIYANITIPNLPEKVKIVREILSIHKLPVTSTQESNGTAHIPKYWQDQGKILCRLNTLSAPINVGHASNRLNKPQTQMARRLPQNNHREVPDASNGATCLGSLLPAPVSGISLDLSPTGPASEIQPHKKQKTGISENSIDNVQVNRFNSVPSLNTNPDKKPPYSREVYVLKTEPITKKVLCEKRRAHVASVLTTNMNDPDSCSDVLIKIKDNPPTFNGKTLYSDNKKNLKSEIEYDLKTLTFEKKIVPFDKQKLGYYKNSDGNVVKVENPNAFPYTPSKLERQIHPDPSNSKSTLMG